MRRGKSEEKYVDVPGGSVYVRIWHPAEPSTSPPIVLLHDSLGCVALWREFPAQLSLSLGRTVVAYDRLGFGRSSERVERPSRRFIDEEAEIVFPSLCASLGLKAVVPFGHSVGGGMAIAIAAIHSRAKLCSSLIAESAQPFIEEQTINGIEAAKQYFSNPINMEKLTKYHGNKAHWVLAAWTETWLDPEFRGWNLVCHLKEVQCPVLAIHGDNDEYGSVAFPNFIAGSVSGHSLAVIMDGVAHVPHHEDPRKVMEIVKSFLTKGDEHNVVTVSS